MWIILTRLAFNKNFEASYINKLFFIFIIISTLLILIMLILARAGASQVSEYDSIRIFEKSKK